MTPFLLLVYPLPDDPLFFPISQKPNGLPKGMKLDISTLLNAKFSKLLAQETHKCLSFSPVCMQWPLLAILYWMTPF